MNLRPTSQNSEPLDQMEIPHPRIGFHGVINENVDLNLIAEMADLRPDFHFIIMGPIVKIEAKDLPQRANLHYLGKKEYKDLPNYLSGWDCTMMPFIISGADRFINPDKISEYLSVGKPVVSTSVDEVVEAYGDSKIVHLADDAKTFVEAIEAAMNECSFDEDWTKRVDDFLTGNLLDENLMSIHEHRMAKRQFRIPSYMDSSLRAIGIV